MGGERRQQSWASGSWSAPRTGPGAAGRAVPGNFLQSGRAGVGSASPGARSGTAAAPPSGSRWAGAAAAGSAGRGSRCPAPRAKQQVIFTRWYLQNVQLICHPEPGSFPLPPPSPFPLSFPRARRGSGGRGGRPTGVAAGGGHGPGLPGERLPALEALGTGNRCPSRHSQAGPVGGRGARTGKARSGGAPGPREPPAAEHRSRGAEEERGAAGARSRGGLGGGPERRASCQEARAGAGLALPLASGPAPRAPGCECGGQLVRQTLRGGLRPEAAPNHGGLDRSTRALLLFRVGKVKLPRSCTSTFCVPPPVRAALHSGSWQLAPCKSSCLSQNFIDEFISSIDLLTVRLV